MTPSELKRLTAKTNPYFFTRGTMKFFGDRMSNYGCRSATITDYRGNSHEAWELYRKRPVGKHRNQDSTWFDKTTLERIFPA